MAEEKVETKVEEITLDEAVVEKTAVEEKKTYSQDEIDNLIKENDKLKKDTSGLDRKVSELLKKDKARDELDELKKKEAMSEQEKRDYDTNERLKKLDDYENRIRESGLKEYAEKKLEEFGINRDFSEFVKGSSDAEIAVNVQKLKTRLENERLNVQKEKVKVNSYSVTNNNGIEADLDEETLLQNRIDSFRKANNTEDAIKLQFALKNLQREKRNKKIQN